MISDDAAVAESRRIWQHTAFDATVFSDEVLRARARHIARADGRLRLLRRVQEGGTTFGVLASIWVVVHFPQTAMRIGAIGLMVAFAFRWFVMLRSSSVAAGAGPVVSGDPSLVSYRKALTRRIADDSGPLLWSRLAIGVPATAVFLVGFANAYPSLARVIALEAVATAGGLSFAFASAVRRARRCRRELDALDAFEREL